MFDTDLAFRNYILTSRSTNPDDLHDPNTKVSDKVMSVISKVPSSADIVYSRAETDNEFNFRIS